MQLENKLLKQTTTPCKETVEKNYTKACIHSDEFNKNNKNQRQRKWLYIQIFKT